MSCCAAVLEGVGVPAVRFGRVGWRLTTEAVRAVFEEMELDLGNAEVLILQYLDNNCFYLMDEDTGAMTLPTIEEKNVYHAPGPLVLAKDQQLEHLLNKLSPIFEW